MAPRLMGCYRTFDQYDNDALSFCYGDAMEKYSCAFVFDVYEKRINVYDTTKDAESLSIYLSYGNLVDSVEVEELSDDIATRLHLSGADGLSIRDVNPTGTDYIVNLDYFLHKGDLDVKVGNSGMTLADRVREWQTNIAANQTYYTGLVSARASLTAQKLTAEVELTEIKGELDNLTAQQSVTIQAMAMETTDAGKAAQQSKLDSVSAQISAKNTEISSQEAKVKSIEAEIERYMSTLWKTAKLAIGLFATKDVGTQWGVNAEMLAGNILIGNKLILQNPNDEGYMMFQIDETGAWLYNAQFVLQDGNTGGLIIVDPKYGIVAGTKLLFDTNGTTVTPEFMDSTGDITFDSDGMPKNANFFFGINDGNAYFRGRAGGTMCMTGWTAATTITMA